MVTARSDAGRRLDELYPRHRVPLVLEELDADRVAEAADAALVAYPHGAAAPAVKALRERGLKVVDLSADFRLDQGRYESYYQPHGRPSCSRRPSTGSPSCTATRSATPSWWPRPAATPPPPCSALAPLRGLMRDVVVDAKSGVSGAGREATDATHFVSVDENVSAYKVEGHRHRAELEQELGDGAPITFIPHLVPLDQGLLASCYVTLEEPAAARPSCASLLRARLRRRAVHRAGGLAARRARRARHQLLPHPRHGGAGHRARDGVRRDRQPLEGRRRPGRAGPQPDARPRRDSGAPVSFFRSRWVEAPPHVRELEPAGLPAGFRAAGVAAGLKPEGLDVGVLVSDLPETVSAARFTTNARVGAPVTASREADLERLRAVVANSDGSNTGDGRRGLDTAYATQRRAAELLGIEASQVGVASTGVIGVELPREPLLRGVRGRAAAPSARTPATSRWRS